MIPRFFIAGIILSGMIFSAPLCPAQSTTYSEAEQKAKEIYEEADSDVIYLQNVLKSLYYQNIQIIELLEDIRALMDDYLQTVREENVQE